MTLLQQGQKELGQRVEINVGAELNSGRGPRILNTVV